MKATIEAPKERMVTLEMTEDEAKKLNDIVYNTDPIEWTIAAKIYKELRAIL